MTLLTAVNHWKNAPLVLVSALIGYAGLSFSPAFSPLILAVPLLWTLASSRYTAFAVMFAYNIAVSRGLFRGAAVFLSDTHTPGAAACLWLLMPLGVSLPFGVFWSAKKSRKAIGIVFAFLTAYVLPPVSLIGIANPLMAAGTVFRGWGFAGMIIMLAVYSMCAVSRRTACVSLCVITAFAFLPSAEWHMSPAPGIIAVDTSFGRLGSGSFNFERDYERANMVFGDLKKRDIGKSEAGVIVLPETIAGRLNRTGLELWKGEIQKLFPDKAVIFGAELPTGDGMKYDNAILMLHAGEITMIRQRIPVPNSMYRGPFAETGANLHLFDNGILKLPDGRNAAVILCYEAFLTWPFLVSMIHKPDIIICAANLWWCRETSLPVSQERIVSLWSLLFGVPAVFAWNI
jgi:hypothetical protein